MLKKENRKDRTFIKKTELDGAKSIEVRLPWQRLPFYCCALTFTPFEDAVCTEEDGSVFDFMHIIPYIRKYGKHPVSGVPLRQEDLVPLTFHKNSKGDYHCPVLNMVFTEFTHIVAIKTTGNVFSYEAVEELNLKTNNWKELLTNEPFKRKDIIIIQNPNTIDDKAVVDFDHVKKNLKVEDEEYMKKGDLKKLLKELIAKKGRKFALHVGGGGSKAQNGSAAARATILAAREPIKHKSKPASEVKPRQPAFSIVDASVHGRSAAAAAKAASSDKIAADRTPVNAKMVKSRHSSGATSTSYIPVTKNEFEYRKVVKSPKKKGGVQLHTTHGEPNIKLHCNTTPRASAAVHGRSAAAAAKASSSDKTAAPTTLHTSAGKKPVNARMANSRYTGGATSRSYASVTKNEFEYMKVEKNPKEKGGVQLHTTHGEPDIKLHCDITPRASASVHGRSAAASAKVSSSDKTAARTTLHKSAGKKPANSRYTGGATSRSYASVTKNEFEYMKVEKNPKEKGCAPRPPAFVPGRSVAAAKATSSDKTVAQIAVHMSPDRTPVNSKMVSAYQTLPMDESKLMSRGCDQGEEMKMVKNGIGVFVNKIIAKGSNGTVVYEGTYQNLCRAAVKRIPKAHFDLYEVEIKNLYAADKYPNIVRMYGRAETSDFIYVALQHCDCSLYELVRNKRAHAELLSQNGYPSSDLLDLMRGIVNGVACLHTMKIIHRDLNPRNVLIVKKGGLRPKLFGMGKRLAADRPNDIETLGWRAPEQILCPNNSTPAMDVFNLGCVLFFCLTQGKHPFGDDGRDTNVVEDKKVNIHQVEHISEAVDLFDMLLHPDPNSRPKASDVLLHPLFWKSETRMWFLKDASQRVKSQDKIDSSIVGALENEAGSVFLEKWDNKMDHEFLSEMIKSTHTKYRYDKVQDLLLIIQDTEMYYHLLPKKIQGLLGSFPKEADDYFRHKFPKLLMVVYNVMRLYCKGEGWFQLRHETGCDRLSALHKYLRDVWIPSKRKEQVSAPSNNGKGGPDEHYGSMISNLSMYEITRNLGL